MELEDHGVVAHFFVLSTTKDNSNMPTLVINECQLLILYTLINTPSFFLCLPFLPTFTSSTAIKMAICEKYIEPILSI